MWPQDFVYLAALLIICAYSLFLFTAIFGRVWCGFACPQTVYTEIFMWIERKIEGSRSARIRLDRQTTSINKLSRKTAKHIVWGAVALWTGFTFVGYFTPIHFLSTEVMALTLGPWEWFWVLFYSFATYGNAGWMREQVCKYMCPYARFQSAMFDKDSLIVTYDSQRGEPRGAHVKTETTVETVADKKLGDCIDCSLCVQVCPTGIDIRKGLQYECIGCAACIDACNPVMEKINKPQGLIRFDSVTNIEKGTGFKWTPRMIGYSVLLIVLTIVLGYILATRQEIDASVLRSPGSNFTTDQEGYVTNIYNLELVNKTFEDTQFDLVSENKDAKIIFIDADHAVLGGEVVKRVFLIKMPQQVVTRNNTKLKLSLYTNGKFNAFLETSFLGPIAGLK